MATRKRVYGKLEDTAILMMITSGVIEVDLETAEVKKNGRVLRPTIMGSDNPGSNYNGTRYRIEIYSQGCRRTIARSKLVYMAGTLSIVPTGFEIHHLDQDRYNDSFDNLICLSHEDHVKLHGWLAQVEPCEDTPF